MESDHSDKQDQFICDNTEKPMEANQLLQRVGDGYSTDPSNMIIKSDRPVEQKDIIGTDQPIKGSEGKLESGHSDEHDQFTCDNTEKPMEAHQSLQKDGDGYNTGPIEQKDEDNISTDPIEQKDEDNIGTDQSLKGSGVKDKKKDANPSFKCDDSLLQHFRSKLSISSGSKFHEDRDEIIKEMIGASNMIEKDDDTGYSALSSEPLDLVELEKRVEQWVLETSDSDAVLPENASFPATPREGSPLPKARYEDIRLPETPPGDARLLGAPTEDTPLPETLLESPRPESSKSEEDHPTDSENLPIASISADEKDRRSRENLPKTRPVCVDHNDSCFYTSCPHSSGAIPKQRPISVEPKLKKEKKAKKDKGVNESVEYWDMRHGAPKPGTAVDYYVYRKEKNTKGL